MTVVIGFFIKLNLDAKTNQVAKSNDDVKKILNSFNSIIDGLSTLRNDKGDDNGKGRSFQELPIRYAELAMNASLTVVQFTWSTYKELNKIQK
ncbi:abortive infection family protein [Enterococcus bulliens]